jgi:hypothetical protein
MIATLLPQEEHMRYASQWILSRRDFLATAAAITVPAVLVAGCNDRGTFTPFRVNAFSCNKLRAENGEALTLQWDYDNVDLLKMQKLRFLRLHLSGIAQEIVDLDINDRSFPFTFNGPITVEIQATTDEVTEESPFAPRFSAGLTVNKLQDLFVRATFQSASNTPNFPFLGYTQEPVQAQVTNNSVDVEFTQFAGFFDANGDGRIDPLVQFFDGSTEAFRALSITGVEAEGFGFRQGANFPFQSFNNPGIGRANGMIYAGAIVMNGQDIPYKADDGDGVARTSINTGQGATTASLTFDPIYIGIPLLEAGNQVTMADIQVGNLNQKLVTTVTTNPLLTAVASFGEINTLTVNRSASLSVGDIKAATTGITVSPAPPPATGGSTTTPTTTPPPPPPFDALVDISSLAWQTEYMRDQDLLNVLTLGQ